MFNLASLQFISEIPYQIALLPQNCLNRNLAAEVASQNTQRDKSQTKLEWALRKAGPPVATIQSTLNNRFLMVGYADSSFVVIDRTITEPVQAILGSQTGHF